MKYLAIIASGILSLSIVSISQAEQFVSSECQNRITEIDNNLETTATDNQVSAGLSGGRGHSARWNEPHEVRFCTFRKPSNQEKLTYSSNSITLTTGVDNYQMSACPSSSVITGFIGGWGHSGDYNRGHVIRCSALENAVTFNHFELETLVDNNGMTSCPSGFVMTGVMGGYGHSGAYNQGHRIRCSELSDNGALPLSLDPAAK